MFKAAATVLQQMCHKCASHHHL